MSDNEEKFDLFGSVYKCLKVGIIIYVLYQLGKLCVFIYVMSRIDYFEFGTPDTTPIKTIIRGASGNFYTAYPPRNFIFSKTNEIKDDPEGIWLQHLTIIYPEFTGFTKEALESNNYKSVDVHFTGDDENYAIPYLQAYYGQMGTQALFDARWKLSHQLSKEQPFGNPIQYEVKWNPQHKDFIYTKDDQAILIECLNINVVNNCTASKLWKDTTIVIEYSISIDWMTDFSHIDHELDKILNSFNIQEVKKEPGPNSTYRLDQCRRNIRELTKMVKDIVSLESAKPWRNNSFLTELVKSYIPIGCNIKPIISSLSGPGNITPNQVLSPNNTSESTITGYLFSSSNLAEIYSILEIEIVQKNEHIVSVNAKLE